MPYLKNGTIMRKSFLKLLIDLEPKLKQLLGMSPVKACNLPRIMPKAGVYLFSRGEKHLYVGRTNRLRPRIQEHCRKSASSDSAPFAFKIARLRTGLLEASYTPTGSRRWLETQPQFVSAFAAAKQEVQGFDVRWVEEDRPQQQLLLELYVAHVLAAEYNDFENH
jgi:hypothetical protein